MYEEIITFWFEETTDSQWWAKDIEFDRRIVKRFLTIHKKASNCELYFWRESAEGRLAEIIILDQFSRNIYRNSPLAFSCDLLALALSQEAIRLDLDKEVSHKKRSFFYLPFMHSESSAVHEVAVTLYEAYGEKGSLAFELKHKAIIDRFGRYPHRNKMLNRESTEEEKVFLSQPNSSF